MINDHKSVPIGNLFSIIIKLIGNSEMEMFLLGFTIRSELREPLIFHHMIWKTDEIFIKLIVQNGGAYPQQGSIPTAIAELKKKKLQFRFSTKM